MGFEAGGYGMDSATCQHRPGRCLHQGDACTAAAPGEMWLPSSAQGHKATRRTSPEHYVVCSWGCLVLIALVSVNAGKLCDYESTGLMKQLNILAHCI